MVIYMRHPCKQRCHVTLKNLFVTVYKSSTMDITFSMWCIVRLVGTGLSEDILINRRPGHFSWRSCLNELFGGVHSKARYLRRHDMLKGVLLACMADRKHAVGHE